MKKTVVFQIFLFLLVISVQAQNLALKTNSLFWLSTTPNIGMEIAFDSKMTAELDFAYNPWTFKDDKKMRFWLLQPEIRYWLCEKFEGHFLGVHFHGGQFFGGFKNKRYDGYLAGGGITYGYGWILSPHWNIETVIGVGYARLWYDESPRIYCEKCKIPVTRNYFGPTKATVSFVYIF